jgi:hypothetical protein
MPIGQNYLAEMMEFASFSKASQRYIRRSLDIGLWRTNAVTRWARSIPEATKICEQAKLYRRLDELRDIIPDDPAIEAMEPILTPLVALSAFDLAEARLDSFATYRFLYERLLGAPVRPWLASAFCGAAALPHIHPKRRRLLLQSLNEAAAMAGGWSSHEPLFFPEWVEKVDVAIAA